MLQNFEVLLHSLQNLSGRQSEGGGGGGQNLPPMWNRVKKFSQHAYNSYQFSAHSGAESTQSCGIRLRNFLNMHIILISSQHIVATNLFFF